MKSNKEELPLAIETPGGTMRVLANQGGMAVARYHFTAESDFSPLLAALPGGRLQRAPLGLRDQRANGS